MIPLRIRDFNSYDDGSIPSFNFPQILVLGGRNQEENGLEKSYIFNQNETIKLPDLPDGIYGSTMVLHNGKPLVCGGKKSNGETTSNCFQYVEESWKEFPSLENPRIGAKMMSYETKLLITGGGNDLSTELFNGDSWVAGPQMLRSLSQHCIVPLEDNEGNFLLIGGKTHATYRYSTYYVIPSSAYKLEQTQFLSNWRCLPILIFSPKIECD